MRRVAIRVDASPTLGTGHVSRCLTLAVALSERGWTASFVAAPDARAFVAKLVARRGSFEVSESDAALASADLLVVDHYGIDAAWEGARSACPILVIDDLADRSHRCDLLLDQNLWPDADARYRSRVPRHCRLLLGPRYALLRKELVEHRVAPRHTIDPPKRALISMGGSDLDNHSERLTALLREVAPSIDVDVLIGGASPHGARITERFASDPRVRVHVDVSDIGPLLARADFAIGAGGVSLWERACLGVPTLCLSIAANQVEVSREADRRGIVMYLGEAQRVSDADLRSGVDRLIRGPHPREQLARAGQEWVDGLGVARVVQAIEETLGPHLNLRHATPADAKLYFDWANDPVVRANSFHHAPIPWEEHLGWFERKLSDRKVRLYVAELRGLPVAQVRFELADGRAMISLSIAADARGKRLGSALLKLAARKFFADQDPSPLPIEGVVHTGNQASRRAFLGAGFQESAERLVNDVRCVSYWLHPPPSILEPSHEG